MTATIKADPIPEELSELKLPVQLSKEQIAKERVVALITVLLGRLEEKFCMKKRARGG
jgi:hypothetical protein